MKLSAYIKDIFREFKNSISKVISILAMVALGSLVIVGLGHSGATMRDTLDARLEGLSMPDMKVESTFGLDFEDQAILESIPQVEDLVFSYILDVRTEKGDLLRLHALEESLPSYHLREGRLPETPDEIALDSLYAQGKYALGDRVSFSSVTEDELAEDLKVEEYTVVGLVDSPEYIMDSTRGLSPRGKGSLNGFGLISKENFTLEDYSLAYLNFEDLIGLDRTSQTYLAFIKNKKDEVKKSFETRPQDRLDKIQEDAKEEIDKAESDITSAEKELADVKKELDQARSDLSRGFYKYEEGKRDLNDGIERGRAELRDAKDQLDRAQADIVRGEKSYQEGKANFESKIAAGQAEIDKGKRDLVASRVKIDDGWSSYNKGLKALDEAFAPKRAELDEAQALLAAQRTKLDQEWKAYQDLVEALGSQQGPNRPKPEPSDPEKEPETTEENDKEPIENPQANNPNDTKPIENPESSNPLKPDSPEPVEGQASPSLSADPVLPPEVLAMKEALEEAEAAYQEALNQYEAGRTELEAQYQAQASQLNQAKHDLDQAEAQYQEGLAKIQSAEAELEQGRVDGQRSLDEAYAKIQTGKTSYQAGLNEYNQGLEDLERERADGEQRLKESYNDLLKAQADLDQGYKEFEEESEKATAEIKDGKEEIEETRKIIFSLAPPDYSVETIDDNQGIYTYRTNSERMDSLSIIFPFFFYLVAMLVTITTIQRMIDEQRTQIGTLKSLGFSNFKIASKYYIYGLGPSFLGSFIGSLIGAGLISRVIYFAYSQGFTIGEQVLNVNIPLIILTILVSMALIFLTIHLTVRKTVKEVPADLLRPQAPKAGGHVLLEKFTPLWSRLSFLHKVTARNLFRYKSRMFMTVFGVAGCTALIFFGFAIRDSISQYPSLQFEEIMKYDLISIIDEDADFEDVISYENLVENEQTSRVYYKTGKVETDGSIQDINLVVPENPQKFKTFVDLRSQDIKELTPTDEGAIITEKLAKETGLTKGDTLEIYDEDDVLRSLTIGGVAENYFNHYIYMTPSYYEKAFSSPPKFNADYIISQDPSGLDLDITKEEAVLTVINLEDIKDSASDLLEALDLVIVLLTLISGILAVVVLYNLTNVNISERKRELSTIKVLGFYPKEVTAYIYRETLILTGLGILFGYLLGLAIHRYIIDVVSPDELMMVSKVLPASYIISALITLAISLGVMVIVHKKLKTIDMVEALTGNE